MTLDPFDLNNTIYYKEFKLNNLDLLSYNIQTNVKFSS